MYISGDYLKDVSQQNSRLITVILSAVHEFVHICTYIVQGSIWSAVLGVLPACGKYYINLCVYIYTHTYIHTHTYSK